MARYCARVKRELKLCRGLDTRSPTGAEMNLALLVLFGFTDGGSSLQSGPPVVHLSRTPATQWRLSSSVRAKSFRSMWGEHSYLRWDERNGTLRFVGLSGANEVDADLLAADIATASGIDAGDLYLAQVTERPHGDGIRRYLRYARTWRGSRVVGDEILLVATNTEIGAAWVRLSPISGQQLPQSGEVVWPHPRGFGVVATENISDRRVEYRDRSGALLGTYDPRRFGTATVTHDEFTVGDPMVSHPARRVAIADASGVIEVAGDDGTYALSGPLTVELTSDQLRVRQSGNAIVRSGVDDIDLIGGDRISYAAAATQHHSWEVRDWIEARWPTHAWLAGRIEADVDLNSGTCNAYYTNGTINFYAQNEVCNATGRIASVVYHEVGHGVHDFIRAGGTFASDVSEGSADYISATILDDPEIGAGFYLDGSAIREIETDKRYPDDTTGESHNDGLIWASFLWNLRGNWSDTFGSELGTELADLIMLGALEQGPELTDLMEAVLVADDDDGDWNNGTPNDCELLALLDQHGLGPGALGVVEMSHVPLSAQRSATEGYPLEASLQRWFDACTGTPDLAVTAYTSRNEATLLPELDGTGMEAWTKLPLATSDGTNYAIDFPRQPANSVAKYFMALSTLDGAVVAYDHRGVDEDAYRFWVGDRNELWCEDFDSGAEGFVHGGGIPWELDVLGADDWGIGAVTGINLNDPDAPYSGTALVGTALDADYAPNNASYLRLPALSIDQPGLMRLLSYRRWLSVEDALYDQARLVLLDDLGALSSQLWSNPATAGGSTRLADGDWVLRDHSLAPYLDETGLGLGALNFGYSLRSDAGLEYGGWNIDDLCVVELDDAPAHYRRVELVAQWTDTGLTEVGPVELQWITPWIQPLTTTVLVRKEGTWPANLSDGVIVDLDLAPIFGESKSVIDELPGLERGTSWYYALFTAGREGDVDVYALAVEGENAAVVDFPVRDTGEPFDSAVEDETGVEDVVDTGENEEPKGESPPDCGCSSSTGSGAVGAALGAMLFLRKRRHSSGPT